MADITINREFIIYITEVAPLYPEDTLFPANDIYPDEGTLVIQSTTEDAGIVSGTLHIEEMIADSSMIIGQCIANKFECTLYNIPHDIAGHEITVICKEDGSLKQMFAGYVDESTSDCYEYERHLVAYDNFYYKRDTNVADWWNNFWSNRNDSTLKVLRNSLCDYVGIEYVAKTLVNDNTIIDKGEEYSTLSFGDCLKMICELQACFPNINRLGKIEFVTLPNGTTTISEYDRNQSKFISYTTAKITGVQVYADSNTLSQSIGSEDNPYSITGNIFLLNMNADEVNSCCTTLLNAIKNIEYKPVELYMIVSDLDYELGSQITTDNGTTYLFKNNLSGVLMIEQKIDSKAVGEYLEKKASTINSSIVNGRKLSKLEQTVDGFMATVEDNFENVRSEISQTANSISLGVSNKKGSATITVSITDDTTGETKTSSANVNINADTINLSADDVINLISNNSINLSSKQIGITSNNFSVTPNGKVTASQMELRASNTWDETGYTIKYRDNGEPSIDWAYWQPQGLAKNDEYLDINSGYVYKVAEIIKDIGTTTPSGTVSWAMYLDPLPSITTSVSISTPNFSVYEDGSTRIGAFEIVDGKLRTRNSETKYVNVCNDRIIVEDRYGRTDVMGSFISVANEIERLSVMENGIVCKNNGASDDKWSLIDGDASNLTVTTTNGKTRTLKQLADIIEKYHPSEFIDYIT